MTFVYTNERRAEQVSFSVVYNIENFEKKSMKRATFFKKVVKKQYFCS